MKLLIIFFKLNSTAAAKFSTIFEKMFAKHDTKVSVESAPYRSVQFVALVRETRYTLSKETNMSPMQWVKVHAPVKASTPKHHYTCALTHCTGRHISALGESISHLPNKLLHAG